MNDGGGCRFGLPLLAPAFRSALGGGRLFGGRLLRLAFRFLTLIPALFPFAATLFARSGSFSRQQPSAAPAACSPTARAAEGHEVRSVRPD